MDLKTEIRRIAEQKNALIMAHYYQRPEVQDVADVIGDSLALAQQAAKTQADIIVMCGVHFMAETAAILCPEKKVLLPDHSALCSLADSCSASDLYAWKQAHPGVKVVSYVNTTAAVKALSDVIVTSSNAIRIVSHFPAEQDLLFGPDHNLGAYVNAQTHRNMQLWNGGCHVHARFSASAILRLKQSYPDAMVLAHPECAQDVLALSDVIGSTQALLQFVQQHPEQSAFIIATESGVMHKMQEVCPGAILLPVPPIGQENKIGACNECEYMRKITLKKVFDCLLHESGQVRVEEAVAKQALRPIEQMLEWSK